MFKLDERQIIAQYKGQDSDQIYATKKTLFNSAKMLKTLGMVMMIAGVPLLILFVGIFIIPAGFFIRKIGKNNMQIVDEATAKYCREIGIEPV